MSATSSRDLIAILRDTLHRLEESSGTDSPALVELKRKIVRTIAELEVAKAERSSPNEDGNAT